MNMNTRIGHLHFWCQKVLPLVYDNSLSYYEVLLKLKNKLNEVIDYTNQIPEYIDEKVKDAFDEEHLKELISEVFRTIEDAITANNEGTNTHFSTNYPITGTLVWHDNKLYKTKHPIDEGDTIIPNSNIELVNFGDMFDDFLTEVKTRFTDNDDGDRETASTDRPVHDLVWLHNELYEVIKPIAEGNGYIYTGANKNVESINLDKIYDYLLDLISSEIDAREQDIETVTQLVQNEATAREQADIALGGRIDDEATARYNADVALGGRIDDEATARYNADVALGGRIDDEATARVNADNALDLKFRKQFGNNILIVGNGCNFTTITEAVNSIASVVSMANKYLILIKEGIYSEHVDLSGINGLALYGLGNVIIQDTSTYPMATIYVTGNISLYNLHLVQYGDAYCIHSDTQGTNSPVVLRAENCEFQRTQMATGTYQHCIGWGSCDIGGDQYDIFNCHFIGGTGIGGHLNPFTSAIGNVAWRVCNCTFEVDRAVIDWGDACKVINGVATNQHIAAVFCGNQASKGVIYQVGSGELFNYFPPNTFCSLYRSSGNNIPALNNAQPTTQWIIGSFAQTNAQGIIFIPFTNAHKYTWELTYAKLHGNNTDILASCNIYGTSPNGISVQTNNYSAVADYCVQLGALATPNVDTVL